MAGKIKVSSQQILDLGFEITKKEGISAVNARRLANELACSIQPVYYYFNTMDELRNQIVLKARNEYNAYVMESKETIKDAPFKAVGLAYLKFAKKEPQLFKLLYMNEGKNKFELSSNMDDNYEYILSVVMNQTGLEKELAKIFYGIVWVATHGIATMLATNFMCFNDEEISDYLSLVYRGVLKELSV